MPEERTDTAVVEDDGEGEESAKPKRRAQLTQEEFDAQADLIPDEEYEEATREAILAEKDLAIDWVKVPEWRKKIRLRELSAADRDQLEASIYQANGTSLEANVSAYRNFRARLVQMSCINEDGTLMFKRGDVEELGRKKSTAIQRIFNKATELSAYTQQDIDKLVGNSEADRLVDSPSS